MCTYIYYKNEPNASKYTKYMNVTWVFKRMAF